MSSSIIAGIPPPKT
ncbi:unnamed protein product, partial [Onchocerca ochengi]|uniref:Uncharacterized protein n=1 Tax=Onchocerca ochengi TaxID=42157 RepID=A0A182F016_ONCOC